MVPGRIAQALAPWPFALALDRWGGRALAISAGVGLAALAALTLLPSAAWAPAQVINEGRRFGDGVQVVQHRPCSLCVYQKMKYEMKAGGQLAGGIAHDFNNLLSALVSNVQLMRRRLGQGLVNDLPRYVTPVESTTSKAMPNVKRHGFKDPKKK